MFLETIFRRHVRPGALFLDVGANLGYWSAFAAMLVGREGEVHAFEPVPAFFASLERLKHNSMEQEMEIRKQLKLLRPGETTFILPEAPQAK